MLRLSNCYKIKINFIIYNPKSKIKDIADNIINGY